MYIHLSPLVIGKYMSKCISINKIKRHIRKFSVAKSANDIYWPTISVSNAFSLEDIIEFKENIELYNVLKYNQFNIDEINYILKTFTARGKNMKKRFISIFLAVYRLK